MPLHLVPKLPKPARKRRPSANPAEMLQCHRCDGREVIESRIGAVMANGKLTAGTKQVLCALCLMRGERVVLA